jgi:predicted phage-related endonuclease
MNITNRTTHEVQQGTGPWLRLREGYNTASEAPAAMGVSRYVTRADMLRQKHTGLSAEHSPATLGKFAAGHDAEARARPLAEAMAAGDLYPTTISVEVDGLRLLASLDGQTLEGDVIWETKLWNEELAAAVRQGADALPEHYTVQMDQELLVAGAQRCLFTCTDGTPERFVSCWYEAKPERFAALVAGWHQFRADLAAYVIPETVEPARAEQMESLPAVSVRLDGALSVVGNLPSFAVALREFVAKIPQRPATDTEFATTEAACKALKRAEEALDAAEAGALASITDVDAMRRAVADCRKLARDTRLAAEKMVERRKIEIKEQAVMTARRALDQHIAALNAEIAPFRAPYAAPDFAGAIKGLRSFASMQDALDSALANGKIAADTAARDVRKNIEHFKEVATGLESLYPDLGQLVHKSPEDFRALVQARVLAQQERDRKAEEARQAAEAQRIAAAEQRAREQEASRIAAELAAQRAESERLEKLAEERRAAAADAQVAEQSRLAAEAAFEARRSAHQAMQDAAAQFRLDMEAERAKNATVPAADLVATPEGDRGPRVDEPANLTLGAINARLGIVMTGGFVETALRVAPARTEKAARLYTETQFVLICNRLQAHIGAMVERHSAVEVA